MYTHINIVNSLTNPTYGNCLLTIDFLYNTKLSQLLLDVSSLNYLACTLWTMLVHRSIGYSTNTCYSRLFYALTLAVIWRRINAASQTFRQAPAIAPKAELVAFYDG